MVKNQWLNVYIFEEKKMVKTSNLFCMVFVLVICLVSVGSGNGAVLFSENWNSGVINAANWTVIGRTGICNLQNLGGGDYALALRGYQDPCYPLPVVHSWGDCIYSAAFFPRSPSSSRIYVQYKAWYQVNVQMAMHGGWHFGNAGPIYNTIEAAVDYQFGSFKASEDVFQNGIQTGPVMGSSSPPKSGLNGDWGNATSKAAAILIRITLDNVRGAKWQHSRNNGVSWITDRNTMGIVGTVSPNFTGNSTDNFIGFGPFYGQAGRTLIDDIEVGTLSFYAVDANVGDGLSVSENAPTSDTYTLVIGPDATPTRMLR